MSRSLRSAGSRVAVIGGGIAGLATAALLAREGREVTLLEARPDLGGRAGRWEQDGFSFDTGPSWYLMPEVFNHFFRLLGTSSAEQLDLVRLDPSYRVFFEGDARAFDLPAEGARDALKSLDPGAARAIDAYLDSADTTYAMAVQRFLYGNFTSLRPFLNASTLRSAPRLARLLLQPMHRFIAQHTSDPRLQQILGYPAVFLGTSPYAAPSMYHLMSHLDVDDGVYYPRGGFGSLIDAVARLAEQHGARLLTGSAVTSIDVAGGQARAVSYTDPDGAPRTLETDLVVSSADLAVTEQQLLAPEHRSRSDRWWTRRDPGPGAVLAMLGVRGELPELAHHSLLFVRDWKQGFDAIAGQQPTMPDPASIYVSRTSATDDVAPEGDESLFILVPAPANPAIGSGGLDGAGDPGVEAIADRAIAQISAWAGIPDLAERVVLRRTVGPADFERDFGAWRGGAIGPAHTLRQSAFFRGSTQSSKVANLLYAGATTVPGVGLPMCLISAELVLKRLRGDSSATPLEAPL